MLKSMPEGVLADPQQLVEVCKTAIDNFKKADSYCNLAEQEAQLKEIARTVERLEKAGVAVPAALRSEKTRLAAELATPSKTAVTFQYLADEFEEILEDLKAYLVSLGSNGLPKAKVKRARVPKTSYEVLRDLIIKVLKKNSGSAHISDVMNDLETLLAGKLFPRDLERRQDGQLVWKNNVQWERLRMTKEGILKGSSRRGVWELSEANK
ncbi:MAG: hypothetical protein HQL22_11805 [Candidatus Omnitrophica bacterium]|nr:hypothetical protein [Candidatus Omnitrophota bacterium]